MMADRWLRWYDGTVRDGKFRIVADEVEEPVATIIGIWASLLEDAATSEPRGTITRSNEWHAKYLEISAERIGTVRDALERLDVFDGDVVVNWHKRQFETDAKDPTSRVRKDKFNQRHNKQERFGTERNAAERFGTPETETETETEKKDSRSVADATRPKSNLEFEEFWKAYPKRQGSNPKQPARKKFEAAIKSGVPRETIISAARSYAVEEHKLNHIGTPYVAQAVTWLNQQRYLDYQPQLNGTGPPAGLSPEQRAAWVREQMRRENVENQQGTDGSGEGDGRVLEASERFRQAQH